MVLVCYRLADGAFALFDSCSIFPDLGGERSVKCLGIEVIWEEAKGLEVCSDRFSGRYSSSRSSSLGVC